MNLLRPFAPRSLAGRAFAMTMLLLAVAQLTMLLLFNVLILRPETNRLAGVMAQNLVATIDTLNALPAADRARAIDHLSQSPYITVWTGAAPPDNSGPPPRAIERVFMRALVKAMGDRTDLFWRTDHRRKLWLHIDIGGSPYWLSVRSPPALGPTGTFALCGLMTFGLALIAAWGLRGRMLRPLDDLRRATETWRLSTDAPLLAEDGPEEIAALSRSFNGMTARLQAAEAERSLILAGISHDVRTPLAKLKLAFEMMKNDDADLHASAGRQIDQIDRILSQFMTFARGFEAEAVQAVDPAELMADMVEMYGAYGAIAAPGPVAAPFPGRKEALRRAVMNLIENAVRYGAAPIEIAIAPGPVFIARDHGPGVQDGKLDTLTDPFVRGDDARQPGQGALPSSGTGLGLAIVDKVARLHGGQLVLRNLPDGFEAVMTLGA